MTTFRYNQQLQPPAPFAHVKLGNPFRGEAVSGLPAQLDTAADQTVVPLSYLAELHLRQSGERQFVGIAGDVVVVLPAYLVQIQVHSGPELEIEVVGSAHEPWVLLGRDVLNHFHVELDGPGLRLEIRT